MLGSPQPKGEGTEGGVTMWLIALLVIWAMFAPGGAGEVLFLSLVFSPVLLLVWFLGETLIHIIRGDRK
jgi:hypothetical protein